MITWVKGILKNTVRNPDDGLPYTQEMKFLNILMVLILVGFLAYGLAMTIAVKVEMWSIVAIDTFAMSLLVIIFSGRFIPLAIRIHVLVLMALVMAISLLLLIGPHGPGLLYLVGFNLLTALLLGLRRTFYSLSATVVVIGLIAVGVELGFFEGLHVMSFSTLAFVATSVNVLLISSICSIPLAILVQQLEKNIRYQNAMRKRLQHNILALSEAKVKAEESDRLKSSFLANMSHEIRTPLNAILGFSDIIKDQPDLTMDERNEFIITINDSGNYLLNIIENILDISMIEANQLNYYKHEVNLLSLFKELSVMYDPRIKNTNGVEIIFNEGQENLDLNLFTDGQRLKQIFVNLINNALKNTREGCIEVSYKSIGEGVEFSVNDTGRGIHPADQEKIFKRFIKIPGEEHVNVGGTGLGLPITKGILDVLGGTIRLDSTINKGTTFYFSLPYGNKN